MKILYFIALTGSVIIGCRNEATNASIIGSWKQKGIANAGDSTIEKLTVTKANDLTTMIRILCWPRELCPLLKSEYVEVILYKKMTLGEHSFYYCDGKIKRRGFNIHGYVGNWKEYSHDGTVIKETDYGSEDKLDTLRMIKYQR